MPWKWLLALILILPFAGMALGQTASNDGERPDIARRRGQEE